MPLIKAIRASQPLNCVVTGTARTFLRATGIRSEYVITHLLRYGAVRARLPNGRLLRLWSSGDWISNQVYWRGWDGYEPETARLFFEKAQRARVTIDVGAHVGFFTLLAAHANPNGRVYAFEPMPGPIARLRQHIALNQLENIECIAKAVGEAEGIAEFFYIASGAANDCRTYLPSSSSLSFDFMSWGGATPQSLNVEVTTLDHFVSERSLGRVDLVKIDTESTEPQVLRGMAGILNRDRPDIICEVLKGRGSESAVADILRPLGYNFYLLGPDGPVRRETVEGDPTFLNYFFTVASDA